MWQIILKDKMLLFKWILLINICCILSLNANAQKEQEFKIQIKRADEIKNDSEAIKQTKLILQNSQLSIENRIDANVNLIYRLCLVRRFQESITLCYENLNLSRQNKNDSAESVFLKLLATNYYYLDQRKQALDLFQQSLIIAEKHHFDKLIYNISSNIGGILIEMQEYEKAEKALIKSLKVMEDLIVPADEKFITLRLLGTLYEKTGKIKSAEKMYQNLIEKSTLLNDSLSCAYLYTFYSNLLCNNNNFSKAIELINKAIPILQNQNEKKALLAALNMKRQILIKTQKYQETIDLDNEIMETQQKLYSTDLNKEISETEVKYKTAEIAYQKKISEIKAKKQQQIHSLIFISTILLISLMFYFFYQRKVNRQKAAIQKERLASIISGEEKERNRIANELHDGIGQMISAVKMNLSALESEISFNSISQEAHYQNLISLVDDSFKELRNISHNMAPNSILSTGLANAVQVLIQKIDNKTLSINFHSEGLENYQNKSNETIIYRIIQECIQNTVKHANCSQMDISIIKDSEGISISIEDNGQGFNTKSIESTTGIGLLNIKNRINYLNGHVEWDTEPGKGTLVAMFIPV